MKKVLLTTTALVMTAGVASAEITFSGSGEAGFYRTGKVKAVAAAPGKQHTYAISNTKLTKTASTTAATSTTIAAKLVLLEAEKGDLALAQRNLAETTNGSLANMKT